MDFRGQRFVVIGSKRSGLGAAELLLQQGALVTVMDERPLAPEEQRRFDQLGIPVVPQQPEQLAEAETVVLSPAVPADLPMLTEARSRGVPVIGELELASYFLHGPSIGITGSNGKTTTTALVGHLLSASGIACQVGGNIGTAPTAIVESSRDDQWNVLELSSFQLETIFRFRAELAACLNITPDHLDRHHTLEAYIDAKARLVETQRTGDHVVLNFEDPVCRVLASRAKGEVFWFSVTQRVPNGLWLEGHELWLNDKPVLERAQIRLRGMHNVENAMAASLLAWMAGAGWTSIGEALATFAGVEHRLEFVQTVDGVEYFNDSKATNVDATLKALHSFDGHLWVILGGKDKDGDFRSLRAPLAEKARAVLLVGAAAPKIREQLEGAVPLVSIGAIPDAVKYARGHAEPGDIVLLAPACASFDQFQNFEHRGRVFKESVAELVAEPA